MNVLPPIGRQMLVASGPILASLTVGGISGYIPVLLHQLSLKESSIPLDLSSSTWMASVHGITGTTSIFVPALMQRKGRRIGYVIAAFSIILGSLLIYFAKNVQMILIGECMQGFGWNSAIPASLITISEMVDPKIRSITMLLFAVCRLMGIVFSMFLGYFLDWRIIVIVLTIPITISLFLVFLWPESPPWLACRGEFDKCEEAFKLLRGTGADATRELNDLITAQKQCLRENSSGSDKSSLRQAWIQIRRRDFYVPMYQVFVFLFCFYFSGTFAVFTYASTIIETVTKTKDSLCFVYISVTIALAGITSIFVIKYFNNRPVLITSFSVTSICLLLGSIVLYYRESDVFPKISIVIIILSLLYSNGVGVSAMVYNVSTELIPVKHRGLGGALFVIMIGLNQTISQKIAPYLFIAMDEFGTFLFFSIFAIIGAAFIWKCVQETKGKTLQEIEDFYNIGHFSTKTSSDSDESVIEPIIRKI